MESGGLVLGISSRSRTGEPPLFTVALGLLCALILRRETPLYLFGFSFGCLFSQDPTRPPTVEVKVSEWVGYCLTGHEVTVVPRGLT